MSPRLLLIDNYDSFTWNLHQYFAELGAQVQVVRNDAIDIAGIKALAPTHLCISPGPCTPSESGISLAAIEHLAGQIPILGVCLGHQAIAQVFGAKIVRAAQVMHGKNSTIEHDGSGLFAGLPPRFSVTRYHSLCVAKESMPDCLRITAWTDAWTAGEEGEPIIMGLQHKTLAISGVQFHPEAILSEHGHALLGNFLRIAALRHP